MVFASVFVNIPFFQFLWASDILLNKNPNRDGKQGDVYITLFVQH